MFRTPVTVVESDVFKAGLDGQLEKWERFVGIRRRAAGEDLSEAADLLHLLLAYNLPGLPGYVMGSEIPGTDIHSLRRRETLMGKYFPFSVKQGLINKFMARENIFFKFAALSTYYEKPVFVFFLNKSRNDKSIEHYSEKIKAIFDWLKIIFHKKFDYIFVDISTGEVVKNSDNFNYPRFTRDVFEFFLLTDFMPLGIPYFFCKNDEIRLSEMDSSWRYVINQTMYDRKYFATDIFLDLPLPANDYFLKFFIEWSMLKGSWALMDAMICSSLIFHESCSGGTIYAYMEKYYNYLELFYDPTVFLYIVCHQAINWPSSEVFQKCFYLTLREKRTVISAGIENILSDENLKHLSAYLYEPAYYSLNQFRNITVHEKRIKDEIRQSILGLREGNCLPAFHYTKRIEERYNIEGRFMEKIDYPVSFSSINYSSIVVNYREGLEKEWELELISEEDLITEVVFRAQSIEEIFLYAIMNGIEWKKRAQFRNVSQNISTKTEKLWSNIESWHKSDKEQVFIGINYVDEIPKKQGYPFLSQGEDLQNQGDMPELIREISIFIKESEHGLVKAFSFRGSDSLPSMVSKLSSPMNSSDEFRLSLCYDAFYRPILNRIENLLKQSKTLPFIMKESRRFNMVTEKGVTHYGSFAALLKSMGVRNRSGFTIDRGNKSLVPYSAMSALVRSDKASVFYLGRDYREIFVFYAGIYAGGYTLEKNDNPKEYLISLFTFLNSLLIFMKIDFPVDIYTFKNVENEDENSFANITSSIEFESLSDKRALSILELKKDLLIKVLLGQDEVASKSLRTVITELAKKRAGGSTERKNIIDYCTEFPIGKYTPVTMMRIKLLIEKALKKRLKNKG